MTQSSIQSPVTIQELLVSSPWADRRTGEVVDQEGADHPRRVYAEDFRGTGDVSEAAESYPAITISEI